MMDHRWLLWFGFVWDGPECVGRATDWTVRIAFSAFRCRFAVDRRRFGEIAGGCWWLGWLVIRRCPDEVGHLLDCRR